MDSYLVASQHACITACMHSRPIMHAWPSAYVAELLPPFFWVLTTLFFLCWKRYALFTIRMGTRRIASFNTLIALHCKFIVITLTHCKVFRRMLRTEACTNAIQITISRFIIIWPVHYVEMTIPGPCSAWTVIIFFTSSSPVICTSPVAGSLKGGR